MKALLLSLSALAVLPVGAQNITWAGSPTEAPALWSTAANWTPAGPPHPGSSVFVIGNQTVHAPGYFFQGPALDVSATITNLQVSQGMDIGSGFNSAPDYFGRNLTVTGNSTFGTGNGLMGAVNGCTYQLGTLTNQGSATLLTGCNLAVLSDHQPASGPAVISWRDANIVRNEAYITLAGPNGFLRDQNTGLDALRSFNANGGSMSVINRTYVTPGAFTNLGFLQVASFGGPLTRFETSSFVNYDAGSGVLNGGYLLIQGFGGRAEFAFPNADIRTLASGAVVILEENAGLVDAVTGDNALRHLGELGGNLAVADAFGITPANGTLQQVAGTLDVRTNGFITVTGDLENFQGANIRLNGSIDTPARLVVTGNVTVRGHFDYYGPNDDASQSSLAANVITVFGEMTGTGTATGNVFYEDGGGCWPGTPPVFLRPASPLPDRFLMLTRDRKVAAAATVLKAAASRPQGAMPSGAQPGRLRVNGNFALSASSQFGVSLGGTVPGSGHSVLEQGQAGGVELGGILSIALVDGYRPIGSAEYVIVTAATLSGQFTNAPAGSRLATLDGAGSFRVSYVHDAKGGRVILSDYRGPLGTSTVFTGGKGSDPANWFYGANWTLGAPGETTVDAEIPSGFSTFVNDDFLQLNTLRVAGRVALESDRRLEFGNITLRPQSPDSAELNFAGFSKQPATVATHALFIESGEKDYESYAGVDAGLILTSPGTVPLPLTISKTGAGYSYIGAEIAPFAGGSLEVFSGYGGQLEFGGVIRDRANAYAGGSGAQVVFAGSGGLRVTGANTYSGGTIVERSLALFEGGSFAIGGPLLESTTGSATGSGPVLVRSTPGSGATPDQRGALYGTGPIAGNLRVEGGFLNPGNGAGGAVDTLTVGGNLALVEGPQSYGPQSCELLVDFDPQHPDPAHRNDRVLLTSPTAQVQLTGANLGHYFYSPPSPGQTFRVLDAPSAGPGAIQGNFNFLPEGASLNANYGGISFALQIHYGPNYVELVHAVPPAMSYYYLRTFSFNPTELDNPSLAGPLADANQDGISNLLAYALGNDLRRFPTGRVPRAAVANVVGISYGVIEIRRVLPLRPDLTYTVAETTDLAAGFGPAFDLDDPANAARIVSRTDHGDGSETVVVRASQPVSAGGKRFLRFGVALR